MPRVPIVTSPGITPTLTSPQSSGMDRVIEAYLGGVDRSLLMDNSRKTPEQRVLTLMALQRLAREAREAGQRLRGR